MQQQLVIVSLTLIVAGGTPLTATAQAVSASRPDLFAGTHAGDLKEVSMGAGAKLKLRWCPPGRFLMGSPAGESGRDECEDGTAGAGGQPVSVTLTQGFWLAETELTQGQWLHVMGTKPWIQGHWVRGDATQAWRPRLFVKEGLDYPATYISYGDARTGRPERDSARGFCLTLTEQERQAGELPADWEYRLPTEAQWEYACRAGTHTAYSYGNEASRLVDYGWFAVNAWDVEELYPHRGGLKQPNAWGLRDMHGNVFEWCADAFENKLRGGTDPTIPWHRGALPVIRGAGWFSRAAACRSASRNFSTADDRDSILGFRPLLMQSH